jgi:hypothetical protein
MKKLTIVVGVLVIIFPFLWNMNSCSNTNRGSIIQEGKIMTIDPVLHKVYVEIPLGIRPFILMGEVNSGTVFLKDGFNAGLSDFSEGEPVIVQWKKTKDGQIIELIMAKTHAHKYGRLRGGSYLL